MSTFKIGPSKPFSSRHNHPTPAQANLRLAKKQPCPHSHPLKYTKKERRGSLSIAFVMKKLYYLDDFRGEKTQLTHGECCLALAALLVDRSPRFSRLTSLRVDALICLAEGCSLRAPRDWR